REAFVVSRRAAHREPSRRNPDVGEAVLGIDLCAPPCCRRRGHCRRLSPTSHTSPTRLQTQSPRQLLITLFLVEAYPLPMGQPLRDLALFQEARDHIYGSLRFFVGSIEGELYFFLDKPFLSGRLLRETN